MASTLLDAPVLGSLAEVEAGRLVIFAGGADDTVARLSPLLSTLGTVVHVGGIGAGSAAKLVANFSLISVLAALGEASRSDATSVSPTSAVRRARRDAARGAG